MIPPDGIEKTETFTDDTKVETVIKDNLPPGEKQNWANYLCKDGSKRLEPATSTLESFGVKDGDTLVITKREGGGGSSGSGL